MIRLLAMALVLAPLAARADGWTGSDKALHLGVSAALAGGAYDAASLGLDAPQDRALVAGAVALSAGAGKELVDALGHGDPSLKDLAADAAGALCAVAISVAVDLALNDRESLAHAFARGFPLAQSPGRP